MGVAFPAGAAEINRSTSFQSENSERPEQPRVTNADPPRIGVMDFVSESLKVRDACEYPDLTGIRLSRGNGLRALQPQNRPSKAQVACSI